MSDTKENPGELLLLPACDDDSREYQAVRGKTTARQDFILFVPNKGQFDRYLPVSDIRLMEPHKGGREIIIECSTCTVRLTGKNLRAVANAIANHLCGSVEAFDPIRRDRPAELSAPLVESVTFHEPVRQQAQGDQDQPPRGGKPTIVK